MSDAVPGFHVCEHCDEPFAADSDTCPNCMYTYDDDEPLTADEWGELRELEAEYWDDDDDELYPAVCEHCGGTGREADVSCPWCQGLGTLT